MNPYVDCGRCPYLGGCAHCQHPESREREAIQRTFVRVCRDSRFKMSASDAAKYTAKLLGNDSIDGAIAVWIALGTENMTQIASGEHPCLKLRRYGGTE